MLQWQSLDIHVGINVCYSILHLFAPRVPAAALRWVRGEQGRSRSRWPSPCSAASPQHVRAAVPPSAVPARLTCPSPARHRCESPDLTQPPQPATASRCRKSTSSLIRDPAARFRSHTRGLSGLKKHPKSSELWTGMAILSIKHNIYHNLLLKLSGDVSPPFHGPELQKKAWKWETDRTKLCPPWCRDS